MSLRISVFFTLIYFMFTHVIWSQNLKDENGKKHGKWVVRGKDRPKSGYPSHAIIEEGTYSHGRKTGVWIKYNKDGIEYQTYFDSDDFTILDEIGFLHIEEDLDGQDPLL